MLPVCKKKKMWNGHMKSKLMHQSQDTTLQRDEFTGQSAGRIGRNLSRPERESRKKQLAVLFKRCL